MNRFGSTALPNPATEATPGLPLVQELTPAPGVFPAFEALSREADPLLFESALQREPVGRYSFLTADPFAFFEVATADYGTDPLAELRSAWRQFSAPPVPGLPPFQGGAGGLAGYELGHAWERIPTSRFDEFELPDLAVGLYDWVVAWDHAAGRAWVISQGFPEMEHGRRRDRAAERLRWVVERLQAPPPRDNGAEEAPVTRGLHPSVVQAPQWPVRALAGLTSDFSREAYLDAVAQVIEYIRAGDIFQANLSQRLLYPAQQSPIELYARLRVRNPAPFAGFFAHEDWTVVSASPERFVSVRDGEVETRPIKGTRQRRPAPEADLFTRDELRESAKDQAENVMIVDLLRNDLSRVCEPGSLRVPQLCTVETYETVQHLVSEIRGRLGADCDAWDLLRAVFPGGSITGAPKIRAMEIIAELEPTARGPYCGSLFYAGYDGSFDSSILIRTFTVRRGWIQCRVGGGIVAQSEPADEYEETLHKAEGMLRALQ